MKKVRHIVRDYKNNLIEAEGYDVVNHKFLPEVNLFVYIADYLPTGDSKQVPLWAVAELKSGLVLVHGLSRKEAIENIIEVPYNKEQLLKLITDFISVFGIANEL